MTQKRIHIIIALMGIALVGIIFLQGYWIRQAMILGEANFNTGANDALNQTVDLLSKQELAITMFEVYSEGEGNNFVYSSDDLHQEKYDKDKKSVLIKLQNEADEILDGQFKWVEHSSEKGDSFYSGQTTFSVNVDGDANHTTSISTNRVVISGSGSTSEKEKTRIKSTKKAEDLFFNTLIELKAAKIAIEDRLDSTEIAAFLTKSLTSEGISDYDYQFAVRSKANNQFILLSEEGSEAKFASTNHCVQLFEGLGLGQQYELCLYFPNENLYLLREVGGLGLASILFTSIILICFWLSIRTIFRQKKLSEMKNDFINNMTHELKTPLATISLAADSLANPIVHENSGQITHYTEIIKDENSRMHRQVERVLQAARFDRGEIQLKHTSIDIHQLIEKVVKPFYLQIEEKQGVLDINLDAENSALKGDQIHLVNVINNLLDNANKYSPENPQISISTRNEDNHLVINVSDKGVGINPSEQAHIFDRFYRVSSGNLHEVKGFGLGLSYVREIVEAHGGEVSVHSTLGKGSTFVVALPLT